MKARALVSLLLSLFVVVFGAACGSDSPATTDSGIHADASGGHPDATPGPMDSGMGTPDSGMGLPDSGMETPDTGMAMDSGMAGGKAFGEACGSDAECTSNVCRLFGMLGGMFCTQTCTMDTECPAGMMGQKCNGMGVCRP